MTTKVFVPRDSAAISVGAEAVVDALETEADAQKRDLTIDRNGSRGMYWLEPFVEVATSSGRVGYGPVRPDDVSRLLQAGMLDGADHSLSQGLVDRIPYLQRQDRLTFVRCGITDPTSIADYVDHGGFQGLKNALKLPADQIIQIVQDSELRGRGGAGFPVGRKWRTVAEQGGDKYVICNADEGDSGTFSDRMIMEGDPHALIEGMVIAGLATGAEHGFIYIRSEYPHAALCLAQALEAAREAGYLGPDICASGSAFDIELRIGAGSYVCGEETAMLESLEGRRGVVRSRPPMPAVSGLFGRPTVVNNVISLATIPVILNSGAGFYRDFGLGKSRGTLPLQLSGNVQKPGLIETAFGISLRELVYDYGGGTATGRPVKAVQVGGPTGAYFPESMLDTTVDYETVAGLGGTLGHGGLVVFDDQTDMAEQAQFAMEFCAFESCGKCTPCRVGAVRGAEVIGAIRKNESRDHHLALLEDLCDVMEHGSLCGLGGLTPLPVRSALRHFSGDFLKQ